MGRPPETNVDAEVAEFELADPDPAALIESLRAFGYTPETAVADLLDNSITARAKSVWIDFEWSGSQSTVAFGDDGQGMTDAQLLQAMRPGSTSPRDRREADDLGRFGLGLKTASFSQCRHLTVITKTARGEIHARQWDLDLVVQSHEWRLIKGHPPECEPFAVRLAKQRSGTVVIWGRLDRIVGDVEPDDEEAHQHFLNVAASVRDHLAMTYHRFLHSRTGLTLEVNGNKVPPWDPFLTKNPARQVLPAERLYMPSAGAVLVQPFILPHRSKLAQEDFDLAGGERGWNSLQGFYVYRNKRLLVAGDWLGLGFQKEEHYKLARIQVDITNDMDALWQIDVRKSMARPPTELRGELRRIAKVTRQRAVEVYRHRGKVIAKRAERGLTPMWNQKLRHGKVSYEVNRNHPAVRQAVEAPTEKAVRALLKLVEETIPIPQIAIATSERPEEQAAPFEGLPSQHVTELAGQLYEAFRGQGAKHEEARDRLMSTDPFQYFPELVEYLDSMDERRSRVAD